MPRTFLVIIGLITGLIFFAGSTISSVAASKPPGAKKQSWKHPRANKNKGWRVGKKTAGGRKQSLKKKTVGSTKS